jgi:[ribosomal protein S18]-alanine N-acetyltransferase
MDSGNLTIAEFEERDLVEILAIDQDSFPTPWSAGLFRSEKANPLSRMLVARSADAQGSAVAGYIVIWQVADEIHLHTIAVRKDLQRRGIASLLLIGAIRECRAKGARIVTLEVRPSNLRALNLYEKFGFSIKGVRRGYYTDTGEDALIMSADLEQIPLEPMPTERTWSQR